jgi:hypothetical protein
MNLQSTISTYIHWAIMALGGVLVARGLVPSTVAAQVAQMIVGAVLLLGASALHSLRLWVDAKRPSLAPLIDALDGAAGQTVTQQTATESKTTVLPAPGSLPLLQKAANGGGAIT